MHFLQMTCDLRMRQLLSASFIEDDEPFRPGFTGLRLHRVATNTGELISAVHSVLPE